ncbi:MAG: AAA family ATPase [Myxococcota bacterium]
MSRPDEAEKLRQGIPLGDPFVEANGFDLRKAKADQARFAIIEGDRAKAIRFLDDAINGVDRTASSVVAGAIAPLPLDALTVAPPPRRWVLRHPTRDGRECAPDQGDGLLPRGKAGMLVGEGGSSKTMAAIALALSVATHRPWLGHFEIARDVGRGRVLLMLAEEDPAEVHRRFHAVARGMALDDQQRQQAAERIHVAALAGRPVALVGTTPAGKIEETSEVEAIRSVLAERGGPDGWALVILDPLARWASGGVEGDNDLATRAVQVVESFCQAPGNPTVLVVHHSSKIARRTGTVDARGVTALTDAVRWVATLRADEGGRVAFGLSKSNYSRPMPDELELVRGDGGVLRARTDSEREEAEAARTEAAARRMDEDVDRVVRALAMADHAATSVDQIVRLAAMRLVAGRAAVRTAIDRGRIHVEGAHQRTRRYTVADQNVQTSHDVPRRPGTPTSSPSDVWSDGPDQDVPTSGGYGGGKGTWTRPVQPVQPPPNPGPGRRTGPIALPGGTGP